MAAMALVLRQPSRDDWDTARPEIERLRKNQQTADYIARQLGRKYGLKVTKKMVYDRFREWQAAPKYKRSKQRRPKQQRAMQQQQHIVRGFSTPATDKQVDQALFSIGAFLDGLVHKSNWPLPTMQPDLDFQRLTAEALMAISSTSWDTTAVWKELKAMGHRVHSIVGTFSKGMHPRVLSVLLRLLVQNQQTDETQRDAVKIFRRMIWKKAIDSLQPSHPVSALCAVELPPEKTEHFLAMFTSQLTSRLHDRIRDSAPDFVALEKIYTARALASFGFPGSADTLLDSAATLRVQENLTRAEYHRTVGFSQFQKDVPALTNVAIQNLELALDEYKIISRGSSTEAMYVHYNLASAYRRMQDLQSSIDHLEAALGIWEGNSATHQGRGGTKYVLDLHEAYLHVGRYGDAQCLRARYDLYFEESPVPDA